MPRKFLLPLLLGASLALSGCVASIAASAVGAAVRSAQSRSGGAQLSAEDMEKLKLSAAQACRVHGSQFGTVNVIDLEQRSPGKIVVWGTVASEANQRSFNCTYTDKVDSFKFYSLKG